MGWNVLRFAALRQAVGRGKWPTQVEELASEGLVASKETLLVVEAGEKMVGVSSLSVNAYREASALQQLRLLASTSNILSRKHGVVVLF